MLGGMDQFRSVIDIMRSLTNSQGVFFPMMEDLRPTTVQASLKAGAEDDPSHPATRLASQAVHSKRNCSNRRQPG